MLKAGLFIGLLVLGFQSYAQIDEVRRITKTLCSPEFHGRGYYAKGDSIAAEFLVDEFEKLDVRTYKRTPMLQPFTMEGINLFSGNMRVAQNGIALQPGTHFMVDPSSSGGQKTLVPFPISIETALDEARLKAAIAQFRTGNSGNAFLLDFGKAKGDTLKQLQGLGFALIELAPVIEVTNQKFTWSVGREQLAHPYLFIQDSIVDQTAEFVIHIDAEFLSTYATNNVVAYLPAKKKCKETIVFTAHYDHLGRMGTDTYFPGGNDNASGTAMLLTMAKYFKENPSDYNVLFIAFAGEEAGLEGSHYFTENPIFPLKKIRFLINLDIMGSGEEGVTAVNATLFEKEFQLLTAINDEKQLLAKIKSRGPAANSDHYWFTEKGVPAFFIYTMGPNKNYHDVFDTFEALSFEEYADITTLLVTFVERLEKR